MNNNQFILVVAWISAVSGLIGYEIGGFLLAILAMFSMPGFFLYLGD